MLAFDLKALIKPLVEPSWLDTGPGVSNSAPIFSVSLSQSWREKDEKEMGQKNSLARTLPNSTPHWSKELIFQIAPSVKVRCS